MNTNPTITAAHDDWDQHWRDYADAAELNPAQEYRRRVACELLDRYGCGKNGRILDIGSGQGDLARDLRAKFPQSQLAGIELSAAGVEVSARKVPGVQFLQRDLLAPTQDPGTLKSWAEYAVCSEVLEHLDDPALLLKNASAYLAPGCLLVVTVPGGPQSQFDKHIGHRQHFTPASLRALVESSGFEVELATTAGFPFFNLYRAVVILRGRRLIEDVQSGSQGSSGALAKLVMSAFRFLFSFNLLGSKLGWQTLAVARFGSEEVMIDVQSAAEPVRTRSFGENYRPTPVDRFGVWLSGRQIRRWVGDFQGKRIGDFGCGYHAAFTRSVLDRVASAALVDVSLAPDLTAHPKVRGISGVLPDALHEIPSSSLDVALCVSVLEHLWEPERAIAEFRRLLAPGGVCLLNVPSWRGKSFLEYSAFRLGLSPAEEMDDHKMYYDVKDLWPLLVRGGFRPSSLRVFSHKFGLNTFAVCRAE